MGVHPHTFCAGRNGRFIMSIGKAKASKYELYRKWIGIGTVFAAPIRKGGGEGGDVGGRNHHTLEPSPQKLLTRGVQCDPTDTGSIKSKFLARLKE